MKGKQGKEKKRQMDHLLRRHNETQMRGDRIRRYTAG